MSCKTYIYVFSVYFSILYFCINLKISSAFFMMYSDDDHEKFNFTEKVYNLDNDVKIWSDFLKARFHPRTITSVDEYKHNDPENVFNNFAQGLELWDSYKMKETWTDNLRLYAEECDYLQVFL